MNTYQIVFITQDGNTSSIFVDAKDKERAILLFESQYEFEAVKFCTLVTDL